MMGVVNSGFGGGPRASDRLPPGQTLAEDWPVLTAGPTPDIAESEWSFTITTEDGVEHRWDWAALLEVGVEDIVTDIHCVTHWSKLDMAWRGVPVESLFEDVDTAYDYVMVECYGGYTTNLSLDDLFDAVLAKDRFRAKAQRSELLLDSREGLTPGREKDALE